MQASIIGLGWITSSGIGRGRETDTFNIDSEPLPRITRSAVFENPYRHFGRMDDYSRIGLSTAALALKDAGLDKWRDHRNIGIIVSTVYGCLDTDMDFYKTVIPDEGRLASPNLFAYTLPSSFLGEITTRFGLTGINFTINETQPMGVSSVQMAVEYVAEGDAEAMICGVCDLNSPVLWDKNLKNDAGAVLFVVGKTDDIDFPSYGKLVLTPDGRIRFNKVEIETIQDLVKACLPLSSQAGS